MSQGRLEGKVCVITGIGGGMGRTAAQSFAAQGAKVVACDIRPKEGLETVQLVKDAGGAIAWYPEACNLADPQQSQKFADFASNAFGGIDVLYNNAAKFYGDWIEKMSIDTWRSCISEELDIVFYLTKAVWPHLVKRGGGSIINTASIAAYAGSAMNPNLAHSAAKAGVQGFTRALAIEGGPHKIRVNSVSPGPVMTPQLKKECTPEMLEKYMMPRMLLGRLGEPEDIVNYALFLATDESTWITGTDLPVDGGSRVAS
jgi:NAD(P)-dependent dehydrogenase (short-subunit alcohol dehydrogenase family)